MFEIERMGVIKVRVTGTNLYKVTSLNLNDTKFCSSSRSSTAYYKSFLTLL